MKLNKLFMLGLAGLAFAACSNEDDPSGIVDDGSSKTLIISVAGIGTDTRATLPSDKWAADAEGTATENIGSLALFFTDASGKILYKYTANKPDNLTDNSTISKEWNGLFGTGVKFIGLEGVTAVHAVANATAVNTTGFDNIAVGNNISALSSTFSNQGLELTEKSGVVYVGSDRNITPFKPEPAIPETMPDHKFDQDAKEGQFYFTAELKLKPIVSRIQITSISVMTSGSTKFDGPNAQTDQDKYTLTWSNFKPQLHGIYLNNFNDKFNSFAGTVETPLKNTSYIGKLTGGQWLFDAATDRTDDAAYVSYTNTAYGELLTYDGTALSEAKVPFVIAAGQCIAFNVFIPFDVTSDAPAAQGVAYNPTIHFQFNKEVTGYDITFSKTNGDLMDAADNAFVATATTALDYTLPVTDGYLFANISKLYSVAATEVTQGTELQMQAGKIYNMEVIISPVNMTIDLDNPKSYNVVVKVTVLPFTEQNIYPGMGE